MQEMTGRSVLRYTAVSLALAVAPVVSLAQHYQQTNLVSDLAGASHHDANLVNPWGLSRASDSPWWISDNGTGVSTLYDGTGAAAPLVVTIPSGDPFKSKTGTPTGTVFSGGGGFNVGKGAPAFFLFVTEDGTVSGWNPSVKPTTAVIKVNNKAASVFKGATMATAVVTANDPDPYLYVADFRQAKVQVYDDSFQPVHFFDGRFQDGALPKGYAPFNIQNIGGDLYVSFALQDSAKHDQVDGAGLGYVDVFSPTGTLLRRMQHGPWFDAPWGMTMASADFGIFSHDLLVGQFGSGEILVFDPVTGAFKGRLRDANERAIHNGGLWGLSFGNGTGAGPGNTLFISAGSNHEQDGLFAAITAVENPQGNDQ